MFLNTTFGDSIMFGLNNKFGKDQPMSLRINTSKAPTSFFKTNEIGIEVTFDIWIYVRDELAVRI